MLNELDKELTTRGRTFVHYADDSIILVGREKAANRVMESTVKFIEEKLGLKVNVTKSKISKPNGIKFLGYGFYRDRIAKVYKAKPYVKSVEKIKARFKELTSRRWSVSMEYRMRFRLRMCIWKKWKTIRKRKESLIKLGISKSKAWEWANSRKGYARVESPFIMQRAVTNDILIMTTG